MEDLRYNTKFEFNIEVAVGLSPAHKKTFMVMHNLEDDLIMQKEGLLNSLYEYDNADCNIAYLLNFVDPLLDTIHTSIQNITYNLIMTREKDLNIFLHIFYNSIISAANKFNYTRASAMNDDSEYKFNYDVDYIIFRYFFSNLTEWCYEQRNKNINDVVSIGWEDEHLNSVVNFMSELEFKKSA